MIQKPSYIPEIHNPDEYSAEHIERKLQAFEKKMGPSYRNCSFANYRIDNDDQRAAFEQCLDYAHNWPFFSISESKALILRGMTRTGKGHLARSVTRYAIQRYGHTHARTFRFVNWRNVFMVYNERHFNQAKWIDEHDQQILWMEDPLAISGMTDAFKDFTYRFLESRFTKGLVTCVTTNARNDQTFKEQFEARNYNRLGKQRKTILFKWPEYSPTRGRTLAKTIDKRGV